MKKTQFIELKNIIHDTAVSFAVTALLVAFGTLMYVGVLWSGKAFENSIYSDFDKYSFHDMEIFFTGGADDEVVDELKKSDVISDAEGIYITYRIFELDNKPLQAKVIMCSEKINRLSNVEGTIPQKSNETAVSKNWAKENNIHIGDTITLEACPEMSENELIVTALVESPQYLNKFMSIYGTSPKNSAPFDCLFFVPECAFNPEVYHNLYSCVFVRCDSLRGLDTLSEEYEKKSKELKNEVSEIAESIIQKRNMPSGCTIMLRGDNGGVCSAKTIIETMCEKLRYNLSLLFIIVSLMVCYFTISRLIHSHAVLIGTKRATGFKKKQIIITYVLYSALIAIIGISSALLLSYFVVEPFFLSVISQTQLIESRCRYYSVKDIISVLLIMIGMLAAATLISCRSVLKKDTVELLNSKTDIKFKNRFFEKTKLWKKLPLLYKTIINNCLNDKRRVAATFIGISGSASLIMCALTFRISVNESISRQFNNLQSVNYIAFYDNSDDKNADEIEKLLDEENIENAKAYNSVCTLNTDKATSGVFFHLFASDEPEFQTMMKVYTPDGKKAQLTDGIWTDSAYASHYNLKKGDMINIVDSEKNNINAEFSNSFEFHLAKNQIMMTMTDYKEKINPSAKYNIFLLNTAGKNIKELESKLKEKEGFLFLFDYEKDCLDTSETIVVISTVIATADCITAVIIAFFVLMNLLVMFIDDKKYELIVMRINGYSLKDVKKYIYTDTILLSVIGIIIGILIGAAVGSLTVNSMCSRSTDFINHFSVFSSFISTVVCACFSVVMLLIALKKVEKLSLSDINKS